MIRLLLPIAVLALSACSDRSGTDGSETSFASRVGGGTAAPAPVAATPGATSAIKAAPPANADVFALQKLGDISAVDLGPRIGGCTFSDNGREILVAAGPGDGTLPGKAAVRIAGQLFRLDAPPGGFAEVKTGTTFKGEGYSVAVEPTAPGKAIMSITDRAGKTKLISGDWVCA